MQAAYKRQCKDNGEKEVMGSCLMERTGNGPRTARFCQGRSRAAVICGGGGGGGVFQYYTLSVLVGRQVGTR